VKTGLGPLTHQDIIFALLILIPLTLWIGSRIGEGVPFLLGIITAAVLAVAVPSRYWTWELLATPLGVALICAEVLDHRRRLRSRNYPRDNQDQVTA
jgi:hypothetical protein